MKKTLFSIILFSFISTILIAQGIHSVDPSFAYEGETLPVTIVGQNYLFQGSSTLVMLTLTQGSNTTVYNSDYFMNVGSSTLGPNLVEMIGEFSFSNNQPIGYYNLSVGTSTLIRKNNAFYLNPDPNGISLVNGYVTEGVQKQQGLGDPISDLELTLTDIQTNDELISITNNEGFYEFRNLTYGTYTLTADGINNNTPLTVDINSQNSNSTGFNLLVTGNQLVYNSINEQIPLVKSLDIYPTLFTTNVTLNYDLIKSASVLISLYKINGKLIHSNFYNNQSQGNHLYTIDNLSYLSSGVYILKVEVDGASSGYRIIKGN